MKKTVRIISFALCLLLAASLCACGGNNAAKVSLTDNPDEHVEIRWVISSSEPEGFSEVMELANEYLNEKLNVTLDLQCIEPGDYDSKVQLALASGENLDIIWTANWSNPYESNVSKGSFMVLDELLELPELAELKNHYSDGIWGATRVGGKIYGIPVEQVLYNQPGVTFMKDYVEKYNLTDAVYACASMDELEEIYTTVREGEPEDYNILIGSSLYYHPYYSMVNGYKVVDGAVFLDTETELENAVRNRRWNELGFWPADIATSDNLESLKTQGKVFSDYNRYLPGSEGKARINLGYDVIHRPTGEAVLDRSGIQSTLYAISSTCKNPVRALKLVNLMLHDEYMLNLICYGIEGRDYTKDPENPKRMIRDSGGYYIAEFMIGSQFLAYLVPSYEDGVWEETRAGNESARVDDLIEFSFDPSPVEAELSQLSAVNGEYSKILSFGLDDNPEAVFEEKEKKLELAGRQVIIDEINRQLKEWNEQK